MSKMQLLFIMHRFFIFTHDFAIMYVMSFREEVYATVRKINPGHVATYGEVAKMIGRPNAARAVGNALHMNPYEWGSPNVPKELWVPCHRVVAADGSLAHNFGFGGCEEQKARLLAEGVKVSENGKVQLTNKINLNF